ncbi:hypothetical protein Dsin_004046 [Dipteronia sinensis]|uniref:Uncharacterized protein n=1 Tax=Dipteronia sinensis TaxID=43782 RepID=A0AAE0EMQ3_9ROSI|nr:hypothetical protein Dsin_004046 [Dipteronia sinensis]
MLKRKDIASLVLVFVVFGIQTCFSQNIGKASFPKGFVFGTDSSAFQVLKGTFQDQMIIALPVGKKPPPVPAWLVQTWPAGYCAASSTKCSKPTIPASFTIHGLWPIDNDGHVLNKVDDDGHSLPGRKLNRTQFKNLVLDYFPNLVKDLRKKWPSLIIESDEDFWLHEWDRHGRQQPVIQPSNYFFTTRDMAERTDLLNALKAKGIVPGHNLRYPIVDIENAITKKIGYKPLLLCYKTNTLSELVLCVDDAKAQKFAPCKEQKYPNLCAGPRIEFLSVITNGALVV